MNIVTLWYSIRNTGDGEAALYWFLSEEAARIDQDNLEEGWGSHCIGSIETLRNTEIHKQAVQNQYEQDRLRKFKTQKKACYKNQVYNIKFIAYNQVNFREDNLTIWLDDPDLQPL